MTEVDPRGLFEGALADHDTPASYRLRASLHRRRVRRPVPFLPTLGELDLHLLGEGRHRELGRVLGAHRQELDGVRGTSFAVWAPRRPRVSVVGDFNGWDDRDPTRCARSAQLGGVGAVRPGCRARARATSSRSAGPTAAVRLNADPLAHATEAPPATASVVFERRTTGGRTTTGWRARRRGAAWREPDVDLRGAPRLVARPGARLPRARRAARRARHRRSASRTSSSCR